MKTAHVTPRSLAAPQTPARPSVTVTDERAVGREATDTFDGRRWTYRNGFEAVLRRLPADAWTSPDARGWECVKRNSGRAVYRAQLDDRAYYLKYFFNTRLKDRIKSRLRDPISREEWRCGMFALRAGIPVVPPAAYTTDLRMQGRPCSVLVTEAVEPSWALSAFWATLQTDENVRRRRADMTQVIERVAELIARAHQAGFEHTDMHAENILVQRVGPRAYRAVFVDLHSARLDVPVSDNAVLRNLAQLNQWFRRNASIKDRLRFLRAYARLRNEFEHRYPHGRELGLSFNRLVPALVRAAERHAAGLWAQRDRRMQRDGRYYVRMKVAGWTVRAFRCCKHPRDLSPSSQLKLTRDWWQRQLRHPRKLIDTRPEHLTKDSHSAQVARTVFEVAPGQRLPAIVKRPRARTWWRQVRMWLMPSRSARGWHTANALLHRDVPTPQPLALLERRRGPFVLDSMLITEFVPGALDLEAYLKREAEARRGRDWARHKARLGAQLVRRVRQLHQRGFAHLDCKASNLLVTAAPHPALLWIDMDGLRQVRHVTRPQVERALARLHVSLLDLPGLTTTDRVRFLRAYCQRFGRPAGEWRQWWPRLAALAERKRQAKAARTAWKLKKYGRQ